MSIYIRKFLKNIEEIVGGFLVLAMIFTVILGILSRATGLSIIWLEELARFLFVWSIFVGSIVAFKRGEHITVKFLKDLLPVKLGRILEIFIHVSLLIMLLYLAIPSLELTLSTWGIPSTSMRIPTGVLYLVVPCSFILSSFYISINLWKSIRHRAS